MAFTAMRCQTPRTALGRAQRASTRAVPLSTIKRCRHACAATLNDQEPAADSSSNNSTTGKVEPYTRTFKALGMDVIESTDPFPEPEKDFWSSDAFNLVGSLSRNFFIIATVGALIVGGFAARSFNDGATAFLTPAEGPDSQPKVYFKADLETLDGLE